MYSPEITIALEQLTTGYIARGNQRVVSKNLNAELYKGELTCLLGVNGAGKSTLLRTLSAFIPSISGKISLLKKNLKEYEPKELSKLIGVVLTGRMEQSGLSVYDMVSMGRSPYTGFWGTLEEEDRRIVSQAIQQIKITHLQERTMDTLSDGERQKVMIAKALAQETPVIFLDEPTAFLDFPSKVEMMQMLQGLAHNMGKTVFLSTHDLELALQIADKLWLLDAEKLVTGTPKELAQKGYMDQFFNIPGILFNKDNLTYQIER